MFGLFSPLRHLRRLVIAVAGIYVCMHLTHMLGSGQVPSLAGPAPAHAAAYAAVPGGAQAAVVTRNIDGDTIAVRSTSPGPLPMGQEVTVRLLEIDTPETKKPGTPVECGGPAASAFTGKLLPPGTRVVLKPDRVGVDRYGRSLRYVYTARGLVEAQIARAGYARPLLIAPNDAHIGRIRAAARRARAARRGMWGACTDPFAPAA